MRSLCDTIVDLVEEHAAGRLDGQGAAAALLRELPGLGLLSVEQLRELDDLGYQRLRRRDEALALVVAELRLLGEPASVAVVSKHWRRFACSSLVDGWRNMGGPSRDANQLDSALYFLHMHNGWRVLGERQLQTLLDDLRVQEARLSKVRPCP